MRNLRWTAPAERDLDRIEAWLDKIDPALADAAIGAVLIRVMQAVANPTIGSPLRGGRCKIVKRRFGYVILYRHESEHVTILRIRHAREDWR